MSVLTTCPRCGGRKKALATNAPSPASPVEPDTAELTELAATLITRAQQHGRGWELKKVFEAFLTVYPPATPEVPQLSAQRARPQLSADAQYLLQKAQQQMTVNYDGVPDAPSVLLTPEEHQRHQRTLTVNTEGEAFAYIDAPAFLLSKA